MPQSFVRANFKRPFLLTAALPTILLSTANGELLPPGGLAEDFATSLSARPDLGGELAAEHLIPFSLSNDSGNFYVGNLMHDVIRDPGDQTLSFYYQFVNAPGTSVLGIENLVTAEFAGYETEVAVLTDIAGETSPHEALRSLDGASVTFDFDTEASRVTPGGNSFTFLVKTNATAFDEQGSTSISAFIAESEETGSSILAGGGTTIGTFRPVGAPVGNINQPPVAVPLPPAALAAVPTMLGTLAYMRRLRKKF